jgi:hypothetical protein
MLGRRAARKTLYRTENSLVFTRCSIVKNVSRPCAVNKKERKDRILSEDKIRAGGER